MKIVATSLQLAATHFETSHHVTRVDLRLWPGTRAESERPSAPALRTADPVSLSDEGKARQVGEATQQPDPVSGDPMLSLLRLVVEQLTGRPLELFDARDLNVSTDPQPAEAPAPEPSARRASEADTGFEYHRHESISEVESTRLQASGVVRTADGAEISFRLDLELYRHYAAESDVAIRAGPALKKDPLVVNFGGTAAQLSDQTFRIDLDADGHAESVHTPNSGSGFLVFDRNGDGRINDGREMFGATSGDGFAELAQLDGDRNGWIDEGDAAYGRLGLWRPGGDGGSLQGLAQGGVGAIGLLRVASPFALRDAHNASLGDIRSSGVWLGEDGTVGTVQQIDLTV